MRNASGHQGENEWQRKKKVNRYTYNISSIKCLTKKFLEVSRCSNAKQQQRNVQKSLLHMQSCFLLITGLLIFRPVAEP